MTAAGARADASHAGAPCPETFRSAELRAEHGGSFGGFAATSAISCPDFSHAEEPGRQPVSVCAVIVAGGTGSRFGNPGGKQLVDIAGRPMVSWAIEAFDRARTIDHIVVVCPAERRAEMQRRAVEPFGFATPVTFADAGAIRQASTHAGLEAAPQGCTHVAIHDGARPLIQPETIDAAVRALLDDPALDGVVCGQPAIDTLKIADTAGVIAETPDRSRYWCVQTPQVFTIDALRAAEAWADAAGFVGTDDASIVEAAGGRVRCVSTPRDNLKVTVPEDLPVVEALMEMRLADAAPAR